jgi:predicted deacylase
MLLYYINTVNNICNTVPEYYIYSGKLNGPTVLIIGTTHGNEPAGYYAIKAFMNKLNNQEIVLTRGKIIFIPAVNYCGLKMNQRTNPILGDINRLYDINNNSINIVNDLIIKFSKESDFILDFHEGYNFNKIVKHSIGSTITPLNTELSNTIANFAVNNINLTISENYKKFNLLKDSNINGTLRDFISKYNDTNIIKQKKDYMLVELTGQNDIQPIEIRTSQGLNIISSVIDYLNLTK